MWAGRTMESKRLLSLLVVLLASACELGTAGRSDDIGVLNNIYQSFLSTVHEWEAISAQSNTSHHQQQLQHNKHIIDVTTAVMRQSMWKAITVYALMIFHPNAEARTLRVEFLALYEKLQRLFAAELEDLRAGANCSDYATRTKWLRERVDRILPRISPLHHPRDGHGNDVMRIIESVGCLDGSLMAIVIRDVDCNDVFYLKQRNRDMFETFHRWMKLRKEFTQEEADAARQFVRDTAEKLMQHCKWKALLNYMSMATSAPQDPIEEKGMSRHHYYEQLAKAYRYQLEMTVRLMERLPLHRPPPADVAARKEHVKLIAEIVARNSIAKQRINLSWRGLLKTVESCIPDAALTELRLDDQQEAATARPRKQTAAVAVL